MHFEQEMKSLDFSTNKQINIHKDYYAIMSKKKVFISYIFILKITCPYISRELGNGTIHFNDTLIHDVKIEVSDVSGNTSTLKFKMISSNNQIDSQEETLKMNEKNKRLKIENKII